MSEEEINLEPVKLHCPKCGCLLIRINDMVKDGEKITCAYMCINQDCRNHETGQFPIYFGLTQEDIDNNIKDTEQDVK